MDVQFCTGCGVFVPPDSRHYCPQAVDGRQPELTAKALNRRQRRIAIARAKARIRQERSK